MTSKNKILVINNVYSFFEKIKSKSEFENIYNLGNLIFSEDRKVKANYLFTLQNKMPKVNFAVAISSKNGNSVWRNRFKRLVRESVRAEKNILQEIVSVGDSSLSIIFSPGKINQINCKQIFMEDIKQAVRSLLNKLRLLEDKKQI